MYYLFNSAKGSPVSTGSIIIIFPLRFDSCILQEIDSIFSPFFEIGHILPKNGEISKVIARVMPRIRKGFDIINDLHECDLSIERVKKGINLNGQFNYQLLIPK